MPITVRCPYQILVWKLLFSRLFLNDYFNRDIAIVMPEMRCILMPMLTDYNEGMNILILNVRLA